MNHKQLSLLIGPAKYHEDDQRMVSMFLAETGKKIICGSSTASMVARVISNKDILDPSLIPGLVLVTEGTLILSQVIDYLEGTAPFHDILCKPLHGQIISSALLEAQSISIFIGMAINKSQRSLSLPSKSIIKSRLVREIVDLLKEKGKYVTVEYF